MVVVDQVPLENYHRMFEGEVGDLERRAAQTAFRNDVKKHVDAIAGKYILPDVTSDGAVMFIPAEAVFAEIHAYHPEVVAYAMTRRVWIVSPTTLMAVLNTARAVLKDVETRKQIHVIKDALGKLAKDFNRFDERMQKLATHIRQAVRTWLKCRPRRARSAPISSASRPRSWTSSGGAARSRRGLMKVAFLPSGWRAWRPA
jgi:DNA recombination protein RmuC